MESLPSTSKKTTYSTGTDVESLPSTSKKTKFVLRGMYTEIRDQWAGLWQWVGRGDLDGGVWA